MKKKNRSLKSVFYALLGVFVALLLYIFTPLFELRERSEFASQIVLFFFFALLIAVFILGIVLVVTTFKAKKLKKTQKTYLLLAGFSPASFALLAVLHNVFYALGEITTGFLNGFINVLAAGSFLLAVFGAPLVFLIGAVGSMVFFLKEKK